MQRQSQFRFDNECYLNLPDNHKRVSRTTLNPNRTAAVVLAEKELEEIDWADEQLDLQAAFAKVRVAIATSNAASFIAQSSSELSTSVNSNNQNNNSNNLTNENVGGNLTSTTSANSSSNGGSYLNNTTTLNHSSQEQQHIIGGSRQTSTVTTLGIYNFFYHLIYFNLL